MAKIHVNILISLDNLLVPTAFYMERV